MLPADLPGDRFGRRRMFIAGLTVFLAGSVLGSPAGDVNAVIAARAVLDVGAALIMPLSLSELPALFGPDETPVVRPTGREESPAMAAPAADAGE